MKLRWKLQETPLDAAPVPDRPGSCADLAFIHVDHPQQIKNHSNSQKVRRHVMKEIGKSRRRNVLRTRQLIIVRPPLQPLAPIYFGAMKICRHFRQIFLALGLSNDGALRLALANTALEYSHNVGLDLQVRVIQDYTDSLGAVRTNMVRTGDTADRNQALATVICLAFYDMRVRNFKRWAMHMDGLRRIIQFSGGLDDLESYHILREALFMADVAGALVFDTQLTFSRPDMLTVHGTSSSADPQMLNSALPMGFIEVNKLTNILNSLSHLAALISRPPLSPAQGATSLARAAFSLAYELLALPKFRRPMGDEPEQHGRLAMITEAVKRAGLGFVSCVITTSSSDDLFCVRHRRGHMQPLLLCTRNSDWKGMEDLQLWVLVLGALSEHGEDRTWLIEQVVEQMRLRGLRSWEDVVPLLRQFAWCDALAVYETEALKRDIHRGLGE